MKYVSFRKIYFFERRLLLSLLFLLTFSLIPFFAFAAHEERITVIGGSYSLSGAWSGALNVGSDAEMRSIGVQHRAETAEGSLVVIPSDTLTFSYTPDVPAGILNGGIFSTDPLVGRFANSLGNRGDCSADPSVFAIGADQYSFVLCGMKPSFSLSSDNNAAVSCSGMVCTASGVGTARITATIAATPVKMWGQKNTEGWQEFVSTTLPNATLSWDVSVVLPPTLTFSMSGTNPIPYDTAVTLSWNAQNVVSNNPCVASGDWSGTKVASDAYNTGNLQARRDYTLRCTGPSGDTVEGTVTVLVGSPTPGPTVLLTADSTLVPINTGTTLRWSSTNAVTCVASGDWERPGPGPRSLSGFQDTGNLSDEKTYILTCFDALGNARPAMVTVRVQGTSSPPSFRDFYASPASVSSGDSTELVWDVRNASTCTVSSSLPGWNGVVPVVGRRIIPNLTSAVDFDLSCTGPGGTEARSVRVIVLPIGTPAPVVTFYADRNNLAYGEETTLHWQTDYAERCGSRHDPGDGTLDWRDHWDGFDPIDSWATGPLTSTVIFRLVCWNVVGETEATVTITVAEPASDVTLDFTADPSTVEYQGGSYIQWQSTNATVCIASGTGSVGNQWATEQYDGRLTGDNWVGEFRETSVFTLTCSNAKSSVTRSVTITVDGSTLPPPGVNPPLINIDVDSHYLSYNTATSIQWNVQNADTCTASSDPLVGSWTGPKNNVSGIASTGNLRAEGTIYFYLECRGPGGYESDYTWVDVGNASQPGPLLSFWADDFVVPSGGSTTLRWRAENADDCYAESSDWLEEYKGVVGSESTGAISDSKSYKLRCWNVGGSTMLTVNVLVGSSKPMPSVSFWSDDLFVPVGGSTILRWTSVNTVSCRSFSNPPSAEWANGNSVLLAGGKSTGALSATQEYTLECVNSDGTKVSAITSVGVGISSGVQPNISNFSADAYLVSSGTSPLLRLSSQNVDTCCLTTGDPSQCFTGGGNIVPTNGIFDAGSGLPVLGNITSRTTYWAVCRHALSGLEAMQSVTIGVGRLLLCPASTDRDIVLGNTLQFEAWYTEDDTLRCSDADKNARGINVTDSSVYDTEWEAIDANISFPSPGLVRGNVSGSARIRVTHKPGAATTSFSETADVVVGLPVTCHRCDRASSRCSSETQFDIVNDPPQCSSDTFSSSQSCRFACFKKRWQEVAP